MLRLRGGKWLLWGVVSLGCAISAAGAEKTARELFPSSTLAYLEVLQPQKLLDAALDHPLAAQIESHPDFQKTLSAPKAARFLAALRRLEDKLGMKWRPAAGALTHGGIYAGFDLPTQGVAVLVQAADEKLAANACHALLEWVRATAAERGGADPVQFSEHSGIAVYQLGDLHLAQFGRWLLFANKHLLTRMILDNAADNGETLAAEEQFQTALKARPQSPCAWLYVDLRVLRLTGALRKAIPEKGDNPAAELLAGGILGALPNAPYFTAALDFNAARLQLTATLPADVKSIAERREFFAGPNGDGVAPPLLRPKQTLLSLATYRDFGSLWQHAPDLFDERINAKLNEAESGLKTIFAGRDFGDEILGSLAPGLQLVVVRQEYPAGGITPAIKLPAAAIVVRMKNPDETARIFKITYQSAIGLSNVAGAMSGIDPLDINSEKTNGSLVVATEYLPPRTISHDAAPIHFNASPTVAFAGEHFILASTRALAVELAGQVLQPASAEPPVNTRVEVDARVGQALLTDNRASLIAQNMLQKGHDHSAAERVIDSLLRVVQGFEKASLQLTTAESEIVLTVELTLAGRK